VDICVLEDHRECFLRESAPEFVPIVRLLNPTPCAIIQYLTQVARKNHFEIDPSNSPDMICEILMLLFEFSI
jgi:hypothetical protein